MCERAHIDCVDDDCAKAARGRPMTRDRARVARAFCMRQLYIATGVVGAEVLILRTD